MLELRTEGMAAGMVTRSYQMAADDPEEALEFTWRLLDKGFGPHPKAARDLLKELEDFPAVYGNNKDQMWRFAQACQEASALMKTDRGHELKMLDYPAARLKIVKRLQSGLLDKWKHYTYKYTIANNNVSPPFQKFCDWMEKQAEERSIPDFDEGTPSYSKESHKAYEKGRPPPGGPKKESAGFTRSVTEPQEQSLASQTAPRSTYGPCVMVRLSHPSSPGKYVEGAAILDNHSTGTWVYEGLCDSLEVEDQFIEHESFTLSTMESDGVRHEGRAIRGLEIAPCVVPRNGEPQVWSLPKCMERGIPSVEEEVASYEDVQRMKPHLAQYCGNFPPKTQWTQNTVILIGRDCDWAMLHTTKNSPEKDKNLMMEETPLGWTLTGPKPTANPPPERQRVKKRVEKVARTKVSPSKYGLPKGLPLAKVTRVSPGAPADLAGIRINDKLMSVGSVSATTDKIGGEWPLIEEFRRLENQNLSVGITRNGHAKTFTLRPKTWSGPGWAGVSWVEYNYSQWNRWMVDPSPDRPESIATESPRRQAHAEVKPQIKPPAERRPGDWLCPKEGCGIINFVRRRECYKCYTQKPRESESVESDQENDVRRKDGGYAYGPMTKQPVALQPGSGKGKGDKEYGRTFDFNRQTDSERNDKRRVSRPPTLERVKEIKTASVLFNFGADGDAGGTLSFKAGEDVEILNDDEDYWWQGVNDQGEEGWFPRCLVTLDGDKQADRKRWDASHTPNGDLQHKA